MFFLFIDGLSSVVGGPTEPLSFSNSSSSLHHFTQNAMRRLAEGAECCGCASLTSDDDYGLGLHVGAIVLLFAVSAAGAMLPVVSKRVPWLSSHSTAIETLMAFGNGVVIATAFIHMINEGVEMLSNPCLGDIVESYECLGLAVVLASVLVMHLIECESAIYFRATNHHGHGHSHSHGPSVTVTITGPTTESTASTDGATTDMASANASPHNAVVTANKYKVLATDDASVVARHGTSLDKKLAVLLLELGVIFHSVIIGIDLGVASGVAFHTLLAAICFHQFFEGIAIGGSALGALETTQNVLVMDFAYAATTPLGLAIGMAIRTTYSPTSVASLWVQGILNCVAGGILLYTGLVQLMTYQMTTNRDFLNRSGTQRLALYVAFWLGAGLMALIGKWA
jgi:solute carrier family 39 (zinc transporter), member 1/2/3